MKPVTAALAIFFIFFVVLPLSGCDASHELDSMALDADICANNPGCYP
jgi:hypothetical protein